MTTDAPTEPLPVLDARDLWFSYGNGQFAVRGVSLRSEAGAITIILGVNGSGKTTFLKLAKGLLHPRQGHLEVLGSVASTSPHRGQLDRRVAYIPQQLGLVRNLSVLDNVLMGALGHLGPVPSLLGLFPSSCLREAEELLEKMGVAHKAGEKVYSLSGGERQRAAIARALMQQPRLILADEFVSQLDPATSEETLEIMRGIADGGVGVVMVTHKLELVPRYADRVAVFHEGEKVLECAGCEATTEELSAAMRR